MNMIESSLHGRERRLLRQIEKTDIEECLAYGIREPSTNGRWKYIYNEVVLKVSRYARISLVSELRE